PDPAACDPAATPIETRRCDPAALPTRLRRYPTHSMSEADIHSGNYQLLLQVHAVGDQEIHPARPPTNCSPMSGPSPADTPFKEVKKKLCLILEQTSVGLGRCSLSAPDEAEAGSAGTQPRRGIAR